MEEKKLDYVLIPTGLLVMGVYHIWLLYTILRFPRRSVIGLNAESRHQWVHSIMTVCSLTFSFLGFCFQFSFLLFLIWVTVVEIMTVCLDLFRSNLNIPCRN